MEFTRKQKILLFSLGGVTLALLAGLVFWIATSQTGDPIPTEPPLPSVVPDSSQPTEEPTPTPTETPASTPYMLPLVPQGGSRQTEPPATSAPTPDAQATAAPPQIRTDARTGVYRSDQKEFLAIGTQNGEAVAVLLVQVRPPDTTVLALPCETLAQVYTLGADCRIRSVEAAPVGVATARAESAREGCWNLIWAVKNLTGYQAPEYLCVDFGCMDSFFAYAPKLETESGEITLATFRAALSESGAPRAKRMGELGVGAVQYLKEVSLWELPGFRNATRDAFLASLSVPELLFLMHTLRSVTHFSVSVLPTEQQGESLILSDPAIPF